MKKQIALVFALFVGSFLAYVATRPSDYLISREITINASAEKIFPYLNSQVLAEKWGPWLEVDSNAKMVLSGPESGVGARANWDSTGQLGTGSATITESVPRQRVAIRLEYVKPMSMIQDSEYSIRSSGSQNIVTWSVRGKNQFFGRLMCIFVNMDKVVGGMFEKGLSNLKTVVEAVK